MSTPSQGLRALAAMVEAVAPELADTARSTLAEVGERLHRAADAQAADEATRLGGPVAGQVLAGFADAMIDAFFASTRLASTAPSAGG